MMPLLTSLFANLTLSLVVNILEGNLLQIILDSFLILETLAGFIVMKNKFREGVILILISCILFVKSLLSSNTLQIILISIGLAVVSSRAVSLISQAQYVLTIFVISALILSVILKDDSTVADYSQVGALVMTLFSNQLRLYWLNRNVYSKPSVAEIEEHTNNLGEYGKVLNSGSRRSQYPCQQTENYSSIMDCLPLGIIVINIDKSIVYMNQMSEQLIQKITCLKLDPTNIYNVISQLVKNSVQQCQENSSQLTIVSKLQLICTSQKRMASPKYEYNSHDLRDPDLGIDQDDLKRQDPIEYLISQLKDHTLSSQEIRGMFKKLVYCYIDRKRKRKSVRFQLYIQNEEQIVVLLEKYTVHRKQFDQKQKYKFQHQLLNSFSHELRTPINCSQQLLDTLITKLSPQLIEDFVHPLKVSNSLLLSQINDILDFAAFQCENFCYTNYSFNLAEMVNNCTGLFEQCCQVKYIKLTSKLEVLNTTICNDQQRIIQVIVNLLNNSIKYTPSGGRIVLQIKKKNKFNHELIKIKVKDSGLGFTPDQINSLQMQLNSSFEAIPSQQSSLHIGLGLNLSNRIVKGLTKVNLLRNTLHLKSEANKFTYISFYIQNYEGETSNLDILSQGSPNQYNHGNETPIFRLLSNIPTTEFKFIQQKQCACNRILIVDDIPFNHQALRMMLQEFGQQGDSVFDGSEAVNKVIKRMNDNTCHPYYQVIFMDIEMPKMNGFEAADFIRQALKLNVLQTQIVICSAYDSQELRNIGKSMGITEFLPKPIKKFQLQGVLEQYIK